MNRIPYNLLRAGLLVALVLTLSRSPLADARTTQQPSPFPCQPATLGKITGTVRDSSGQPFGGVNVKAYSTKGTALASDDTNAAGEYGIPLPPGPYLLEFKPAAGAFQATWYKNGTSPLDATVVEVGDGKTVGGIDTTLPTGAQFAVALRDAEGKPVPGSLVTVFDRSGRTVAEGVSDDAGRALTVPGLPAGPYRLRARPPYGSPLLATYHSLKPTLDAADVLTITPALGNLDVPMTLREGARLSGTVTDAASGSPLADIAVTVRDTGYESRYAMTDGQGRYSVEGLASGTYQVEFRSRQLHASSPAPLRRLVTLSAPNALAGFDAALVGGGTIAGRATTPDGAPLADVSVTVRDIDGALDAHALTAADGTYAIGGLPSGRYTLSYTLYNHQPFAPTDPVTVTAPTTTTVATAVLAMGGAIGGKVTDPDGKPTEGVLVRLLDAATGTLRDEFAYTDALGVYTLPPIVPNGSYIVKFQPPDTAMGCPLAIEYSGNAATAAAATRVTVSGPTTVTGIDAVLDYGGHIAGKLTDAASGLPLASTVEVYDATGALVAHGYGPHGYYRTAAALPPGNYRLRFVVDGYVSLFYGGATVLEAAARVPSGASDISMALPRGGTITGRITAADTGAVLEHALVTLYGAGDRVVATQLTQFDGSYSFRGHLPSGAYRIGVVAGKRGDGTPFFTGYEPVYSGGASNLAAAQLVSLTAPQTISADLAMPIASAPAPTPTPLPPTTPTPNWQSVYLPLVQR